MASRSEEIRAHRFATRRLLGAVVSGRARPGDVPIRRGGAGVGLGILAAAVSLGVAAAIAVVSPAAGQWRRTDAVIVERETGARFLYRDGKLYPVLNYASARLVLGSATPAVVLASRHDLAGAARGTPLGIAGAPDSLPAASDLLTGDWSVCSAATDPAAGSIALGPAATGTDLGERALLVTTAGDDYLVWHGHAAKVRQPTVVLAGLGWTDTVPLPVAPALVNALPAGTPLQPIALDHRGARSPVQNLRVGTVVTADNAQKVHSYAVVTADGLAALTPVQADILLSDAATPGNGTAVPVTERTLARVTGVLPGMTDWPSTAPDLAPIGKGACTVRSGTSQRVVVDAAVPPAGSDGDVRVVVPPGQGALVRTAVPDGADPTTGAVCLLTDVGTCYPVPDAQALSSLGYAGAPVADLPAGLKALLPAGVRLDQQDALKGTS